MLEVDEFSKRGDAPALAILKDNAEKELCGKLSKLRKNDSNTRTRNEGKKCGWSTFPSPFYFVVFFVF